MMPQPNLTWASSDLLTSKVDRFVSLPREPLVPICIEIDAFFLKISYSQVW